MPHMSWSDKGLSVLYYLVKVVQITQSVTKLTFYLVSQYFTLHHLTPQHIPYSWLVNSFYPNVLFPTCLNLLGE